MLIGISHQLLDTGQQLVHDHLLLHALVQVQTEVLHFVSRGSAHLSLAILQQRLECWDQVCLGDVLPYCRLSLVEKYKY